MYVHSWYTESTCASIATPLDPNFSSSIIVHASSHKRLHISETEHVIDLKLGVRLVLMLCCSYILRSRFSRKIPCGGFSQIWSQLLVSIAGKGSINTRRLSRIRDTQRRSLTIPVDDCHIFVTRARGRSIRLSRFRDIQV